MPRSLGRATGAAVKEIQGNRRKKNERTVLFLSIVFLLSLISWEILKSKGLGRKNMAKKNFEYKGVKFDWEQLGEESYSVRCLTPNIDDQNIDYTQHPSDECLSEKIGMKVEFLDGGDDSEYPESIYVLKKRII